MSRAPEEAERADSRARAGPSNLAALPRHTAESAAGSDRVDPVLGLLWLVAAPVYHRRAQSGSSDALANLGLHLTD